MGGWPRLQAVPQCALVPTPILTDAALEYGANASHSLPACQTHPRTSGRRLHAQSPPLVGGLSSLPFLSSFCRERYLQLYTRPFLVQHALVHVFHMFVGAWRRSIRCNTTRLLNNRAGMQEGSLCTCNQPTGNAYASALDLGDGSFAEFAHNEARSGSTDSIVLLLSDTLLLIVHWSPPSAFTWSETIAPICKSEMHNLSCSRRATNLVLNFRASG